MLQTSYLAENSLLCSETLCKKIPKALSLQKQIVSHFTSFLFYQAL